MSFIKSKHSGWTWDLKRTPFGGGGGGGGFVGDVFGGIGDVFGGAVDSVTSVVDDALVGLDKTVGDVIPGGWGTLGAAAAAVATAGSSLSLSAAEIAAADGVALSTYGVPAAEAMATYGVPAAELGLPATATAAQVGAVAGTASAEFAGSTLGQQALGMAAPALESGANAIPFQLPDGSMGSIQGGNVFDAAGKVVSGANASTSLTNLIAQDALALKAQGLGAEQIAQTLSQSYGIDQYAASNVAGMAAGGSNASQIAGVLASDYGSQMAGVAGSSASSLPSLANIVKYASTGSQIIGGLGKLAGGIMGVQTGNQMKQYAGQADPFGQYRPQYAAQLQNLMNNPNSVTTTPGYQFNLAQGLQGLQAQQAAQGRLVSGGALIQGQQFGQNLAQQTYQQQLQTLAGLSGATQSPATGAMAQGNLMASNLGSTYGGWQSIAGGLNQISNPLATLYSNYNNPSPNPAA
jgi:hypothetical protein